jgi:mRNA-degrading endonuclease YafQ of YafQ-DinJ toxin-antitoxin module
MALRRPKDPHRPRRKTGYLHLLTANYGPLPAERLDHKLTGAWADHRVCHAGGDFLLI